MSMETAVNRDYSGEILLRVSPESGRFIVEEHKKNGVVSYKEISPLDFYNTIYGSFDREYFLRSGLLPPNCLQVSFCGEDKYFVLWNPELRADISYKGREYLDFPIPRMVFSIRTLRDGRAVDCAMGVVADEPPTGDTKMYHYEDVLRRELDGLDDDFATLKLLSQELSFRAQAIRAKKAA